MKDRDGNEIVSPLDDLPKGKPGRVNAVVSPRVDARLTLGTLQEEADILRDMALAKVATTPGHKDRTIAGQAIKVLCALTRDGLIKGDYHGKRRT